MTFSQRNIAWAALLGILAIAAALSATVSAQGVPALGTWKLNVAKSKFSPGPAPKSTTVTFSAAGQGVKAVVDGAGPDGGKIHWEYTANFDGKAYPVTGNPDGDMVVMKRVNANTIETAYTLKGKPTVTNTRVLSADGKTLTVTSTGTNAQGQKINNVQVFEKG
jgi:hypothetical protein